MTFSIKKYALEIFDNRNNSSKNKSYLLRRKSKIDMWHWLGNQIQDAPPGNLFQIGAPDLSHADVGGNFKHVGFILDIDYIIWITVKGGQMRAEG